MSPFGAAGRLAALALLALAPTLLALSPALAADVAVGDIVVHQPWARATPGGAQVGGGYLTIENKGSAPDRLTGGSFAASTGFELHSMTADGGVMRMRPAGPSEIPPGKTVALDPSGLHIMFTGLKRGLKKGESVPGTLTFERAGTAKVGFVVGGIADRWPGGNAARPGHTMPGMDMDWAGPPPTHPRPGASVRRGRGRAGATVRPRPPWTPARHGRARRGGSPSGPRRRAKGPRRR